MKSQQAVLDPTHFMFDFAEPDIDMENHPMALLLEEFEDSYMKTPVMGDIRQGVIVDKRSGEWLVDIGFKSEGVVSGKDLERLGDEFDNLAIGDEVPVYVMREDRDGNLMLSISKAKAEEDWILAEKLLENQDTDSGMISGYNRGGVIIKIGQVRGFVPASQLSSESQSLQRTDIDPEERWSKLVGTELRYKVIDLDRRRNRLILSERLAMREWRQAQKEKLLESLKEGGMAEGVVSSLADFGAFVNLGGADGLIHLSELSWGRVNHPSEVIQIGQKVKVQVLSVDLERKRIGLSLRRMQPEPWETVAEKYAVGQVVKGVITKMVNFGAFARLEDDAVEGLIHISELSDRRITHPREVVSEGDEFDLRIIRIDIDRRRMGLSLKQALPEPESNEFDWEIVPLDENPAANEDENVLVAEMAVPEFA
ncbi:MAG: S1 RNA-binding domain-containing protein [Caldilineaceae bacterium]|nr:S1 RNA-binding domain-containing protein [Caldilineaceae bacterium]HRJ42535.1 S1 RNA-binding domain-containing protein [Caldilineaceae bacterium]